MHMVPRRRALLMVLLQAGVATVMVALQIVQVTVLLAMVMVALVVLLQAGVVMVMVPLEIVRVTVFQAGVLAMVMVALQVPHRNPTPLLRDLRLQEGTTALDQRLRRSRRDQRWQFPTSL